MFPENMKRLWFNSIAWSTADNIVVLPREGFGFDSGVLSMFSSIQGDVFEVNLGKLH